MFSRHYSRPAAVTLLLCCTVLWSTAGVLTRHLDAARSFEVTFWRSTFCALFVVFALGYSGGRAALAPLLRPNRWLLISGLLWGTMYSAFMISMTLTSVSNTLVVMSASPLLTALLAWAILRAPIPVPTWLAIVMAAGGMGWMFSGGVAAGSARDALGMSIAFLVPVSSAFNVIVFKRHGHEVNLVPAVCVGAAMSALAMLPLAWPLQTSGHDLAILATLGFFQLGFPCMLMVAVSRSLTAPQISLLALMEVLLGPLWAWLWANEVPNVATLQGGSVVLTALVLNELRSLQTSAS